MADVRAFRGIRYDPGKVDLARVIAPPYDVLSPAQQRELHGHSPFNVVRLEFAEAHATDSPARNAYTRAREAFETWLAEGVLRRDDAPAFYLLRHQFHLHGKPHARSTLFARVRGEDYERRVVLPHESTLEGPKKDRLTLLTTCGANFSPIMLLYHDSGAIPGLLAGVTGRVTPEWNFSESDESEYTLWVIREPGVVASIQAAFAPLTLYIADGHHRYETALAYRNMQRMQESGLGTDLSEQPWNFALAGLVDMDDPGLVVLPYHRVVGGLNAATLGRLKDRIDEIFEATPVDYEDTWLEPLVAAVEGPGTHPRLGVHGPGPAGPALLRLRDLRDAAEIGPLATCEPWILQERVLLPVLGSEMKQHITYVHDAADAAAIVARGEAQVTFILRALPLDLFTAIARAGQRLPPKATYFFPKLPTGVVINPVRE